MSAAPRTRDPEPSSSPEAVRPAEHEFSNAHRETLRALAASMSFVGVCTFLFGALACVFLVGALYAGLVPSAIGIAACAVLCIPLALWMMSGGRSLSALVATRGRDIEHLMEAIAQLRRLFGLARVVIVVVALVAVGGSALLVWCMFLREHGGKCFAPWG